MPEPDTETHLISSGAELPGPNVLSTVCGTQIRLLQRVLSQIQIQESCIAVLFWCILPPYGPDGLGIARKVLGWCFGACLYCPPQLETAIFKRLTRREIQQPELSEGRPEDFGRRKLFSL